ncbi:MAG TPA: hypothetical protein VGJ31_03485 [Dongiaceae bacterium]
MIFTAGSVALLAIAGAAFALIGPAMARAWLFAFICFSIVPIGSLALLLVQGLTGGRWGRELLPVLEPAARATILLIPLSLPILVAHGAIYPWPGQGVPGDVARLYANGPFFALRTLAGLAIWSLLAWGSAWRRPLYAGVGLCLHLLCLTFLPADWILSVQAHSSSASFGLGFGIEQILAALGFVAVLAPQSGDEQANADLAGMIIAALLGTVYFAYTQFVITWYGNLPEKVAWFATRAMDAWPVIAGIAFLCGAALPFLACMAPAIRHSRKRLRLVGGLVVVGAVLHITWLLIPTLGLSALWLGILPAGVLAAAALGIAPLLARGMPHARG